MMKQVLLLVIASLLAPVVTACTVEVLHPNGNELLNTGVSYTILWESQGNDCSGRVDLALYHQGEPFLPIAMDVPNSGSYSWMVPSDSFLSPYYTISIALHDQPNIHDESDAYFGIHTYPSWIDPDYIIPVSAHADGAYGSHWKTDLVISNWCVSRGVFVAFMPADQDNSNIQYKGLLVPKLNGREVVDIVSSVLEREEGVGAILLTYSNFGAAILCDLPMYSKTYNDLGEDGTYGQLVPVIPYDEPICSYGNAYYGLKQTNLFRTNLGLANGSPFPIDVSVKLYRYDRSLLGEFSIQLQPYGFHQELNVIRRVTNEDISNVTVTVESETPDGFLFAYASVIDNRTGAGYFLPQDRPPCP